MSPMSDVLTAMKPAAKLLARAGVEARYAATLLHARGPGVASVPPRRLLPVLRALDAYGPVGASLALAVAAHPDRPALIDEQGPVTFAELDRTSNALANALRERGFRPGTASASSPQPPRPVRGAVRRRQARRADAAAQHRLRRPAAGRRLRARGRRRRSIHDEEFAEVADGRRAVRRQVRRLVTTSEHRRRHARRSLIEPAATPRPPRPSAKQKIVLLTSGTTGTPKGAPRDMALSLALPGGYLSKIPLRSRAHGRAGRARRSTRGGCSARCSRSGWATRWSPRRKTDPAFTARRARGAPARRADHRADPAVAAARTRRGRDRRARPRRAADHRGVGLGAVARARRRARWTCSATSSTTSTARPRSPTPPSPRPTDLRAAPGTRRAPAVRHHGQALRRRRHGRSRHGRVRPDLRRQLDAVRGLHRRRQQGGRSTG